jgi:hypothetical protein
MDGALFAFRLRADGMHSFGGRCQDAPKPRTVAFGPGLRIPLRFR